MFSATNLEPGVSGSHLEEEISRKIYNGFRGPGAEKELEVVVL